MRKTSLKNQLLIGGTLLAIIPALVLGTVTVVRTSRTMTELAIQNTSNNVQKLKEMVREMLDQEISLATALSSLPAVHTVIEKIGRDGKESAREDIAYLNRALLGIVKNAGNQHAALFITDKAGISIAGARSDGNTTVYDNSIDFSDRSYYKEVVQSKKAGIAPLVKSKVDGQIAMVAYAPVISEKGEFAGLLAVNCKVDALINIITSTKIGRTGYGFMLDGNGLLIAHPDRERVLERNLSKDKGTAGLAEKMTKQLSGFEYYLSTDGVEKMASFTPVGVRSWSIAVTQDRDEVMSTSRELRNQIVLAGSLLLVLAVIATFLFGRRATRPISKVAEGLLGAGGQVAAAARQVSSSSQQLAAGASEQAASIEETSSALEEVASMTRQNAEHASQAKTVMAETSRVVGKAHQSMDQLTASMAEISKASEETSKIIKTIDEIAFQTNLLALNAAVEAARAGEAGAGFAVVADEVRNLAMRAAEAAKNTASLIAGTVKKVKDGVGLVEGASSDFSQVAASAEEMKNLIEEVSAASSDQARGIEQVNRSVGEMDKVIQQNAANAEESASAAEAMKSQADDMKSYVNRLVAIVGDTKDKTVNDKHSAGNVQAKAGSRTALSEKAKTTDF